MLEWRRNRERLSKSPEQVARIVESMAKHQNNIPVTRATAEQYSRVQEIVPEAEFNSIARTIVVRRNETIRGKGTVLIVSAGTSDVPVAEEAVVTLGVLGNAVETLYDVGVAELHQLLDRRERLLSARVCYRCCRDGRSIA